MIINSHPTFTPSMSVAVHLTGFGRFRGVEDNPSCHLARGLAASMIEAVKDPRIHIASSRVVEVSMPAADAALAEIFEGVPYDDSCVIIVHLGVAASAKCFHVEQQAANDCTFRCPDESGLQPQGQSICEALAHGSFLSTPLSLPDIAARLHEKWHSQVELSCDAGRFLCNYIYYRSLQRAASRKRCYSVFIHVPLHAVADAQQQADFVCDFVRCAVDHVLGVAAPERLVQLSVHEQESAAVCESKSGLLQ